MDRVRVLNEASESNKGKYVLYWMIASRRASWNFALDYAVDRARELQRPLLVLEPLRAGYRWANDRLHSFVLSGMADNARAFERANVTYWPYVEPEPGAGKGLLEVLAKHACLVVTDDTPMFFLPRMIQAAAEKLETRVVAVDSNGLLPVRAATKALPTAYAFRRFLQKELPKRLGEHPRRTPFSRDLIGDAELPRGVARRWPRASATLLTAKASALAALPIDHEVPPAAERGGSDAGRKRLRAFLREDLPRYFEQRNDPDAAASSRLSPWLHFGHLSVHEVFRALAESEDWDPSRLGDQRRGIRDGFWNMSPGASAFLDELVTWRELGYSWAALRDDYDRWESLPEWAQKTLTTHAKDPRPTRYGFAELERAETHDELWNAAQRQLLSEGRIHNYLRMLWGKKILEWSRTPKEALATLIELNNKWALDGRDPNSYTGIFWVFGRHDRPWAPERAIFGVVRYMSSDSARRKLELKSYLAKWGTDRGDSGRKRA